MGETVLVGDIGGTNCRFALAERGEHGLRLHDVQKLKNDNFQRFSEALGSYLASLPAPAPRRALFALAGPVERDGSVRLVNRNWPVVHPGALRSATGLAEVTLVNDFAAMARAVPELAPEAFATVREGDADPAAPVIVTGPGTGFGVATLIRLPAGSYHVLIGEGGHAAYAAHTVREAELAERIGAEYDYVSTEMIASGAWLQTVFDHLSDMHGRPRDILPPAEILTRAKQGDRLCEEVCALRARAILGAAGDLVLTNGGRGGVVLTGGVAERMIRWLRAPEALVRFEGRGSHTGYMQPVPISVLTNPEAPLIGAATLLLETPDDYAD